MSIWEWILLIVFVIGWTELTVQRLEHLIMRESIDNDCRCGNRIFDLKEKYVKL